MGGRRRGLTLLIVVAMASFTLPACLVTPTDTSEITLAGSVIQNGWQYDFYENTAYECSVSGYQTFMVGTRLGTSAGDTAPLWVWMHGGSVGWFDAAGTPQPDSTFTTEEPMPSLLFEITRPGLLAQIRSSTLPFRMLAVSYCDRDLYAGTEQPDYNNPNLNDAGSLHTTNGLLATEAAIQYTESNYATSKYFLHGGSAGSVGAYNVGYALQLSGNSPAGVVSDSGVFNYEEGTASSPQLAPCSNDPAFGGTGAPSAIAGRLDPALADSNNEIDKLVARGEFTVPLLHIWNRGDPTTCGRRPVNCPLRDNTVVTMGATDCNHEPLRAAIVGLGPGSASENLPVCFSFVGSNGCSIHVVTNRNPASVTSGSPNGYVAFLNQVTSWVCDRLQIEQCLTNIPPTAVNDTVTVTEEDPATPVDVLANDTDIDGGPKSIVSVTQPPNGTVAVTGGGGGLTYQPAPNFCGVDSFTYTLNGGSTATVSVEVTCVDDPPIAGNDTATVTEDDPATPVDVLANDTDIDGGPKTVESVTQPANGTVVITGDGTGLTYQPAADFCGPDSFTYTLAPGGSTATVSVEVTCVDDPPIAVNDTATVTEDDPATPVDVLANDTDIDGGPKTVGSVTQPANGIVVITGDGTGLTYQPAADFCGPDSFTYTLAPGGSTATVSVEVTCVDDPPIAVNDTATVTEDDPATAVDVLANDTDIDGGPKSIVSVTQPANGTVVITGDGTGLSYQPAADFCGPDSFTYTLAPGGSTATVSIEVTCVNDPPVNQVPDLQTINEDTILTFSGGNGNPISVTDADAGSADITTTLSVGNGSLTLSGTTGLTFAQGDGVDDSVIEMTGTSASINAALDGMTYRPSADANGADTLAIATDDLGNTGTGGPLTDSDTVAITVVAVNDAPTFALPPAPDQTVLQDAGPQTVAGFASGISAGPADEAIQTLTFDVSNDNNALFSAQPAIDATTGTLTYTPAPGAFGSAIVSVTLHDNGGTANGGIDSSGPQTFTIAINLT